MESRQRGRLCVHSEGVEFSRDTKKERLSLRCFKGTKGSRLRLKRALWGRRFILPLQASAMQAGVLEGSLEEISAEFNTEKSGGVSLPEGRGHGQPHVLDPGCLA